MVWGPSSQPKVQIGTRRGQIEGQERLTGGPRSPQASRDFVISAPAAGTTCVS
jgi:hypothetical protein